MYTKAVFLPLFPQVYDCYDQTDESNCTHTVDNQSNSIRDGDSNNHADSMRDTDADSPLKAYPTYQTAREGGTAVLRCEAGKTAGARPVRWFKRQANRLVELRQSPNVDLSGSRLTIQSVTLNDAAVYLCKSAPDSAFTSFTSSVLTTVILSVQQGEHADCWSNART